MLIYTKWMLTFYSGENENSTFPEMQLSTLGCLILFVNERHMSRKKCLILQGQSRICNTEAVRFYK
jgi:hypothetical protein